MNVVANALNRKSFGSLATFGIRQPYMLFELNRLLVQFEVSKFGVLFAHRRVQPN